MLECCCIKGWNGDLENGKGLLSGGAGDVEGDASGGGVGVVGTWAR